MPEEFFTPLQEYEKQEKMAQKQYRASCVVRQDIHIFQRWMICCLMKILYRKVIWEL